MQMFENRLKFAFKTIIFDSCDGNCSIRHYRYLYFLILNLQLTSNVFEFMMKLWNAHTENFETKVMSGSGEDLSFMSSLDNSILSLKGNILHV